LLVMSVHAASCCFDCNEACLNTSTTASRLLLLGVLPGCCCCCGACSALNCRHEDHAVPGQMHSLVHSCYACIQEVHTYQLCASAVAGRPQ
jgi:hypothetical protein